MCVVQAGFGGISPCSRFMRTPVLGFSPILKVRQQFGCFLEIGDAELIVIAYRLGTGLVNFFPQGLFGNNRYPPVLPVVAIVWRQPKVCPTSEEIGLPQCFVLHLLGNSHSRNVFDNVVAAFNQLVHNRPVLFRIAGIVENKVLDISGSRLRTPRYHIVATVLVPHKASSGHAFTCCPEIKPVGGRDSIGFHFPEVFLRGFPVLGMAQKIIAARKG